MELVVISAFFIGITLAAAALAFVLVRQATDRDQREIDAGRA
jgi:hypothetical protein